MATKRQQECRELTLPRGIVVPVRTIGPDDGPALQRLYSRLSERSIRLRFSDSMAVHTLTTLASEPVSQRKVGTPTTSGSGTL